MTSQPSEGAVRACEIIEPGIMYDLYEPPTLPDDAAEIIDREAVAPAVAEAERLGFRALRKLAAEKDAELRSLRGEIATVTGRRIKQRAGETRNACAIKHLGEWAAEKEAAIAELVAELQRAVRAWSTHQMYDKWNDNVARTLIEKYGAS